METAHLRDKVALITGAAARLGACITRTLHEAGANIVLHYRSSCAAAHGLAHELNVKRPKSAVTVQADLLQIKALPGLVNAALEQWGRLDVVVNNASSFYPTPLDAVSEAAWDDLVGTNLKAPLFLAQAAAPHLAAATGCIVNVVDIHADRPLKGYPLYCVAKAGLVMLTKSLARELAPEVRVNAVAPGSILWPERGVDNEARRRIIDATALKRQGTPDDIARAALYLIRDAGYVTGHVLTVDGGRSLHH